ncbi:YqzE family protein [Caldibacillus thermoamylovorans]|jgi:hypothetical protein|nr:YqzE family protein [Caldibacillus thermoamylovorans]
MDKDEGGMKSDDYIRFLTKTVVTHFETPKEERNKRKLEKKMQKEPFVYKWFGIFPFMVKIGFKKIKKR